MATTYFKMKTSGEIDSNSFSPESPELTLTRFWGGEKEAVVFN